MLATFQRLTSHMCGYRVGGHGRSFKPSQKFYWSMLTENFGSLHLGDQGYRTRTGPKQTWPGTKCPGNSVIPLCTITPHPLANYHPIPHPFPEAYPIFHEKPLRKDF